MMRLGKKKWFRPVHAVILLQLLASATAADPDSYVEVARGKTLVVSGDCIACHTARGGAPFAGGRALQTPFGTIMAPNITPDYATGLGGWSADDFARAMHEGRRPRGGYLYPAFPYPYYTKVTRADLDAIYAYLRTLAPVTNQINRNTLPFPFNIRLSMLGWNALFFKPSTFVPDETRSDEFNRGAYIVEGLGHCGACHTPFNAFGASEAGKHLQGNQVDNWTAPNITNDMHAGLGKWSVEEIVQYLKTGQTATALASGLMKDVIENSTSNMSDADLKAIAVYLKEDGAGGTPAPPPLPASDPRMESGEAIFIDICAACHARSGGGIEHIFPKLAGSTIATQDDPASLIHIVITGGRAAATYERPTSPAMPSLGFRLTDKQIAAVVTYVRNSWGNAASPVTTDTVKAVRGRVTSAVE